MLRHALTSDSRTVRHDAVLETHLLGTLDYGACLALQQRLVFESSGAVDRRISLLLCEHPLLVTIGRQGSRSHVLFSPEELVSNRLDLTWVARGGGCVLHAPGQLAVYPIVPLSRYGWTVGEFLTRFESGLLDALQGMRVTAHIPAGRRGIWGRSGQLIAIGTAVKNWTTFHGAFVNVAPPMHLVRGIIADAVDRVPASSLAVERQQAVRMTDLRTRLVPSLARAFGCERFQLYTGHPLVRAVKPLPPLEKRRVG